MADITRIGKREAFELALHLSADHRGLNLILARCRLPALLGHFAARLLRAGAASYLTEKTTPGEFVAAADKVLTGGEYFSPALAEKLVFDTARDSDRPRHKKLSDREFQLMRRLAAGPTDQQIADELMLSLETISTCPIER